MSKQGMRDLSGVLTEKFGLDKAQANAFVERMFTVLQDGLATEKIVKVKGLGTFKVINVASRKSVDVNTGAPILIEGRDKISFTPDSDMRDLVNRPFAQFDTVIVNDGVNFSAIDEKFANYEEESAEPQADSATAAALPSEDVAADKDNAHDDTTTTEPQTAEASATKNLETEEPKAQELPRDAVLTEAVTREEPQTDEELASEEAKTEEKEAEEAKEDAPQPKKGQAEESATGKPAAEEPTAKSFSHEVAQESLEPVEQPHQDAGRVEEKEDAQATWGKPSQANLEEDNQMLKAENISLRNNLRHQNRIVRWSLAAVIALLLLCAGGIYMVFLQLDERDYRLQQLRMLTAQHFEASQANKAKTKAHAKGQAAQTGTTAKAKAAKGEDEALAAEGHTATVAQESGMQAKNAANSGMKTKADNGKQKATEASSDAKAKMPVEETTNKSYDSDPRIRTGAYQIVGISTTIKVRSGQTLTSISRAHLGPGMECYLQAVNGGRTEFKAGESIKIPKLKLKKRR